MRAMKKADEQRHALLALTIETVGQHGLGEFSLRHLAAAAGLSTSVIFQNFSGKSELLESALELTLAQDRDFHAGLQEKVGGLFNSHVSFADFLARYILMRSSLPRARFASEMLLSLDDYPGCRALLAQWHEDRTAFWVKLLPAQNARPDFAGALAEFILMEEFYAFALHDECIYALLLGETCRAICDAAFRDGVAGPALSEVSLRLDTQPLSMREADEASDAPIKEQMLTEALRIIEEGGLEALTQRRLAKNAGVSTSAIAYYFNDMKTFRNRAIWRALVSGVPSQLDPELSTTEQPQDLGQWLETLNGLLRVEDGPHALGFYISFARLTGQACLLARSDPSLRPLIAYLRELEGWGTYRVSRNISPLADLVRRDHAAAFGMWIKAEALLRRVNLAGPGTGIARLHAAAREIFPERLGAVGH